MLLYRTEGLYRVFLLCQIIIVAALFWLGVWIMVTFYSEGGALTWSRYSIYCGMLVLGLTLRLLICAQLAHFRTDQVFVPTHAGAVREPFAALEKAAFQNIHVQKA